MNDPAFKCCICGELLKHSIPIELLRMMAEHQKPCFDARLKEISPLEHEVEGLKRKIEEYKSAFEGIRAHVDRVK